MVLESNLVPTSLHIHVQKYDRNLVSDMKNLSFDIYKPQVQGISLSTWGVVYKELYFQLPELTRTFQAR